MKYLKELIEEIEILETLNFNNNLIKGITNNSLEIKKISYFVHYAEHQPTEIYLFHKLFIMALQRFLPTFFQKQYIVE